MSDERYFNFPIWFLRGSFTDMYKVCDDIMDYAIYKHSQKLNGNQRIKDSSDYFGITLGNIERTATNGEKLDRMTPDKAVMTGMNKDLTFDFYKNSKTEFEKAVLLAYLAIKSILGQKSYCRITGDFLLCRMAGYGKKDEAEIPEELEKYKKRWHIDRLKIDLKKNYGLKIYGRSCRGFFVSFKLSQEQLIKEVELRRKKFTEKAEKEELNRIRLKVLRELYPDNKGYNEQGI
jgi:hypothetical protein